MTTKISMIAALCLLLFIQISLAAEGGNQTNPSSPPHWEYDPNNMNEWVDLFPACNMSSQSPINIMTNNTVFNKTIAPIMFNNYNVTILFNVMNNGHTVVANPANQNVIQYVSGSNFDNIYVLKQFHFHWGPNVSIGSEHKIDNKSFAAELHIVHQNILSDTLTVVGFFLEISPDNNMNWNDLLTAVQANTNVTTPIAINITLSNLLPNMTMLNSMGYYRYMGSLTTPPCTEGVIWNVFRPTIKVSTQQMQAFYTSSIKFNARPVQPLNGRTVYLSATQ